MKLKVKFLIMVLITSSILLAATAMGYFYAKNQVQENITNEMLAITNTDAKQLDGWLLTKAQTAVVTSQAIKSVLGDNDIPSTFVQHYKADATLLDLYVGLEDGKMIDGSGAALPEGYDPRKRGWYQQTKEKDKLIFTDAYIDAFTKKYIVSAALPLKGTAGNTRGIVGIDIGLDFLSQRIKDVNINGKGYGFIVDQQGIILAHPDAAQVSTNINDNPAMKKFAKEMLAQDQGMQTYDVDGTAKRMIYTKIPSTGWLLGIAVDDKDVYSEISALRYQFSLIALLGILISVAASWVLASKITGSVLALTGQAQSLASGDLTIHHIPTKSSDEIGQLSLAFSTMAENLRDLIKDIAQTAEQVAASSEELTANAEQSAHASDQVATSITAVAEGAQQQLQAVADTSASVEEMSTSIQLVVTNASTVAATAEKTASAAGEGVKAVDSAVKQMNIIEQTVSASSKVVAKLGARSKEIGQIVDAISGIAGQTNLLALNAAIEAARAGEQGRGFAVVAEEVRKLAEQSQQAAKQIAEMIHEIQEDTDNAVIAMNNGTREVTIGGEVVNRAGQSFTQIEILVEQVSSQVHEIAGSIKKMNASSQKIVAAVQDINMITKTTSGETQSISAATEEQAASMQEIASSSHALANMAEELQKTIRKFSI
jgi:methyl-accepting chemotaxis protein